MESDIPVTDLPVDPSRDVGRTSREKVTVKHNSYMKVEGCRSPHEKRVEVPDEHKTVISVPPRRKSNSESSSGNEVKMGMPLLLYSQLSV